MCSATTPMQPSPCAMDALDRQLIHATQAGLPLVIRPYHALAQQLGCDAEQVIARLGRMLDSGLVRRIGVVPNHYALGYSANGMSVWDVADEHIEPLGEQIGALDFVSHCYRRRRCLPDWPYNLFAMIHGHNRQEVANQAEQIAALLGHHCRQRDILYSTRILKKTGFRLP